MHRSHRACCAHEGETSIDESAQALTRKNRKRSLTPWIGWNPGQRMTIQRCSWTTNRPRTRTMHLLTPNKSEMPCSGKATTRTLLGEKTMDSVEEQPKLGLSQHTHVVSVSSTDVIQALSMQISASLAALLARSASRKARPVNFGTLLRGKRANKANYCPCCDYLSKVARALRM